MGSIATKLHKEEGDVLYAMGGGGGAERTTSKHNHSHTFVAPEVDTKYEKLFIPQHC